MAQDGEMLGSKYHNGRVWLVWGHGELGCCYYVMEVKFQFIYEY